MKRTSTLLSFLVVYLLVNAQNSPNISRVIEYRPAPGQHINRLFPSPEMSDTPENALKFAQEALADNASARLTALSFGTDISKPSSPV